ncbi:inositol phospholipid synthesis and fat-storage-inducing TM-domain-containing protein [Bombardia bombarda]|uniref:Acyl-coenzyme A diphosphatase SCS3 n=1 Tax=Bombardia bombarda TaxID=252184 RepID=A0AA40CAY6_9PEZI|nr:inositol phospholipid synthesis and fat-storage-inducing TM-domain-containing protein [Bombardia bombarda]
MDLPLPSSPSPSSTTKHNPNPSTRANLNASDLTGGNNNNNTNNIQRNTPYLPTPTELALLAGYPILLTFGALFSLLSPETRASPYDPIRQAHTQDPLLSPSYFARKDNLFNVLFVKRGWAWITLAFFCFILTHPALASGSRRARAAVRWGIVTAWWVAVTQWFFGPAIIDRGFRWTGGKCEVATIKVEEEGVLGAGVKEVATAAACKAGGGQWSGGHDISGHVFLLVLGSAFLVQEVGWVVARWARSVSEERNVVMGDGAVKGAAVEMERAELAREREVAGGSGSGSGSGGYDVYGHGGRFAFGVVGLSAWMLLMTAIYFHTWFEKLTGLLVALAGLYVTYILPRWLPALRGVIGLPGI